MVRKIEVKGAEPSRKNLCCVTMFVCVIIFLFYSKTFFNDFNQDFTGFVLQSFFVLQRFHLFFKVTFVL
jgi:hypothetical protein